MIYQQHDLLLNDKLSTNYLASYVLTSSTKMDQTINYSAAIRN